MKKIKIDYTKLISKTTYNYKMFKFLDGINRPLSEAAIARIYHEMKDHGWVGFGIMVNENFEVIDGQHRLKAAERLGIKVHYTIFPGYNHEEMTLINLNTEKFPLKAILAKYVTLSAIEGGYSSYLILKSFIDMYEFSLPFAGMLLTKGEKPGVVVQSDWRRAKIKKFSKDYRYIFNHGEWKVTNYEYAVGFGEFTKSLQYEYSKEPRFVQALFKRYKKHSFDSKAFESKLRTYTSYNKVDKCSSQRDYLEFIDMIINN